MRIAIDGLPLCQPLTGVGHYTAELARHLAQVDRDDQIFVISPRRFVNNPPAEANLSYVQPTRNPFLRSWWRSGLPTYLKKQRIDVFHGSNFELPATATCATVVTIHDLSPLLYPQYHEKKNARRAQRQLPSVVAAATLIVTPTESIRHELHERLDVGLDRIIAVAEAARDCFQPLAFEETAVVRKRLGINDRFLLYVGTLEPRKNLLNLVQAFETVADDVGSMQLVIAGRTGWLVRELFEDVHKSRLRDQIIFTGYLSDYDLSSLYSSCTLFLYPSLYEGFGLPPLEAMACGAPVIASDIASIREVVDASARLVGTEPGQLSGAMTELIGNEQERKKLAGAGMKRAAEFSWAEAARGTRAVYVEAKERFRNSSGTLKQKAGFD
jgi:glycosyltransferase involved in cell wall biosynthesis